MGHCSISMGGKFSSFILKILLCQCTTKIHRSISYYHSFWPLCNNYSVLSRDRVAWGRSICQNNEGNQWSNHDDNGSSRWMGNMQSGEMRCTFTLQLHTTHGYGSTFTNNNQTHLVKRWSRMMFSRFPGNAYTLIGGCWLSPAILH